MTPLKAKLTRLGLDALYYSKIYSLFAPKWSGVGIIFTLHHVRAKSKQEAFSPNAILEITPEFLDATIKNLLEAGYEIVSLDEAQRRLVAQDFKRKFVCFTLDDGYQDNYLNAFPVFKKYEAPFTVYVNTGLPDGTAILWWWLLEHIVRDQEEINIVLNNRNLQIPASTTAQKHHCFNTIYWSLRQMPHEQQYAAIEQLFETYEVDPQSFCRASAMSWDTIRELSDSGIATIGAHTVNHFSLAKLSVENIHKEASESRTIISNQLGSVPKHFSYPYGDHSSAAIREFNIIRDLGFSTATTTRKGLLYPEHAQHLHALPRVSLNGSYQMQRYITLFLSGAPFALWQRFHRLDVN